MIGSNRRISILVLLLVVAGSVAVTGAASAQTGNGFDVDVEFPDDFAADNNQTIEIEVTNQDEEDDLVSPLIEIQNRSDFDINSSSNGTVTVDIGGQSSDATRTSYLNDSSFRASGQALFIEGVSVPNGSTNVYEVNLDVESPGTTDVQIDVRPLNNESNNDRDTYQNEALGFGSIQINSDASDEELDGGSVSANTPIDVLQSLDTDRSYNASANISILDEDLEISGLSPTVSNTKSVWFNDTSSAANPTVVGHTQATANVLSPNTRNVTGNATTPTVVEKSYTLQTDGGSTYLVVENQSRLDPWTGEITFDIDDDSGTISEIDQTPSLTLVNVTVDDDVDGTFQYEGYRVGDQNGDGTVDADDAADIGQAAADSDLGSINTYGDVNDDGKVTVVDAMLIAQYDEDNRDADYDLTGGS